MTYLKLMMMWMWVSLLLHVVVLLLQLLLLLHPVPVLMLAWVGLGLQLDPAGLLGGRDGGRRRDHHLLIGGRRHGYLWSVHQFNEASSPFLSCSAHFETSMRQYVLKHQLGINAIIRL